MSKPREFWLDARNAVDDYYECFVSTKPAGQVDDFMGIFDRQPIHVIEKSAYDDLAQDHAKLVESLILAKKQRDQALVKVNLLREALEYAGGIKGVPLDKIRLGGDGFQSTARHIALEALEKTK